MKYYIKILYQIERKNRVNILLDILCLSLGLLIGIVFMSQASTAYQDMKLNQKYMPLHTYTVYKPALDARRMLQDEFHQLKKSHYIRDIQVFNRLNDAVVWHQDSFCPAIGVVAVTEGYFHVFSGDYLLGEDITDAQSAVIGKGVADKYHITIGDRIEITNHSFTVNGILQIPQYKDSAFVPAEAFAEQEFFDCQYYVDIEEQHREEFVQYLERYYGPYESYISREYGELQEERLQSGWLLSIIIAIVTLCYGLLNIYNIEKFFMLKQKKSIAILRALGASTGKIMLTKMLRSVIIAWTSASVTAVLVWILERTAFGELIEFNITFEVYSISFLMIAVIYMLFSFMLYRQHYRKKVATIISDI